MGSPTYWSCALDGAPTQYTPSGAYSEATTSSAPCTGGRTGPRAALWPHALLCQLLTRAHGFCAAFFQSAMNHLERTTASSFVQSQNPGLMHPPTAPNPAACKPGQGGSKCALCPAGTFSAGGSKAECTPCAAGTTSLAAGLSNCPGGLHQECI